MVKSEYKIPSFKELYALQVLILAVKNGEVNVDELTCEDNSKEALKWIIGVNDTSEKTSDEIDFEQELMEVYVQTKNFNEKSVLDPKEQIAAYKLRTSLLERLIDLIKESKRIKAISEYQEFIFKILNDEQKGQVLKVFGE